MKNYWKIYQVNSIIVLTRVLVCISNGCPTYWTRSLQFGPPRYAKRVKHVFRRTFQPHNVLCDYEVLVANWTSPISLSNHFLSGFLWWRQFSFPKLLRPAATDTKNCKKTQERREEQHQEDKEYKDLREPFHKDVDNQHHKLSSVLLRCDEHGNGSEHAHKPWELREIIVELEIFRALDKDLLDVGCEEVRVHVLELFS